MMRVKRKSEGFTLIEIVVSIAILSIIIIAFSGMFVSGIKIITKSGNRSNGDYEAQKVMESKILNPVSGADGNVTTTVEGTQINIRFGSREIVIPGKTIETEFNDGKFKVLFTTFVPD